MVPLRSLIALAACTAVLPCATARAQATAPVPAPAASWSPDVAAANAFARDRPGHVSFSVLDESTGRRWGREAWRRVPSASLLKPLLMVGWLRREAVRDRALTSAERGRLAPMIRRSANAPASALVVELGATAIATAGRAAGMGTVALRSPWGLTTTSARDQVTFFSGLPELLPERHRAYAMTLLRTVTPSQRWGIGAVRLPGWQVALKGGWGSGTGAVDHQTALLVQGDRRIVVSITTTGNGSHTTGKATLRGVASRLLRRLA